MLPAISRAANPTGTGPACATRPAPSCPMPAGSTGQDGGIAACQSSLTHARSAAAANGRIRQPMPVIIPPAPPRHFGRRRFSAAPIALGAVGLLGLSLADL